MGGEGRRGVEQGADGWRGKERGDTSSTTPPDHTMQCAKPLHRPTTLCDLPNRCTARPHHAICQTAASSTRLLQLSKMENYLVFVLMRLAKTQRCTASFIDAVLPNCHDGFQDA
eukprot:223513-Chlamydomonas_euryale.AAC.1